MVKHQFRIFGGTIDTKKGFDIIANNGKVTGMSGTISGTIPRSTP